MKIIKNYFIFIFAFSLLFVSYLPNFYELSISNLLPTNRAPVLGEHIYTYDYNVYLSKIKQGQEGRFSVVDKYDNHPNQKGVFLQMFYLLSGQLTKILSISPTFTYHLLRIITSILLIITIIWLNIYFLKKLPLINLGVIVSLLTASFPVFYQFQGKWWIRSYMDWWQELDVLKRISFIPHDSMNYIFISVLTLLLHQFEKTKNKNYFIAIMSILFFSVFIHPTASMLFCISWILFYFIKIFWFKDIDKNRIKCLVFQTGIMLLATFIPLLYIKTVTANYPWKSLLDFDQNNRLVLNVKDYILALGPIFFTGILGVIFVIKNKRKDLLGLVTWILGVVVAIIVFKFFPYQSELRFVQTANHIPLAILSVYLFGKLWKKKGVMKIIIFIIIITIIINGVIQAYFSLKSQNQFTFQKTVASYPIIPYPPQVMFPVSDFYNGLKWLENNSDHKEIVLSKVTAGNYIPAYSGNFVYLGHGSETPNFIERTEKVNQFYFGALSEKQASEFLKTENIGYVFYGPQEKEDAIADINSFSFMKSVYQSPLVTIYKVK